MATAARRVGYCPSSARPRAMAAGAGGEGFRGEVTSLNEGKSFQEEVSSETNTMVCQGSPLGTLRMGESRSSVLALPLPLRCRGSGSSSPLYQGSLTCCCSWTVCRVCCQVTDVMDIDRTPELLTWIFSGMFGKKEQPQTPQPVSIVAWRYVGSQARAPVVP